MTGSTQTRGPCIYCGREMTRGGLARHLKTCARRLDAQAAADKTERKRQPLYHLQIQDAWGRGDYWLHLEMAGDARLQDLDAYLRAIWLECCGHLSEFKIGGVHYTPLVDDGVSYVPERSMNVKVRNLFTPGLTIPYTYDFGTSSELVIKVVDERRGSPTTDHPICLMARNRYEPPPCIVCGMPATWACSACLDQRPDGRGEFCSKHVKAHKEHEDDLYRVVNSPRMGMCGYNGPAEPPY